MPMCGCGGTSNLPTAPDAPAEGAGGAPTSVGPKWKQKRKGPTERCAPSGSSLRVCVPGLGSAWIPSMIRTSCASCEGAAVAPPPALAAAPPVLAAAVPAGASASASLVTTRAEDSSVRWTGHMSAISSSRRRCAAVSSGPCSVIVRSIRSSLRVLPPSPPSSASLAQSAQSAA